MNEWHYFKNLDELGMFYRVETGAHKPRVEYTATGTWYESAWSEDGFGIEFLDGKKRVSKKKVYAALNPEPKVGEWFKREGPHTAWYLIPTSDSRMAHVFYAESGSFYALDLGSGFVRERRTPVSRSEVPKRIRKVLESLTTKAAVVGVWFEDRGNYHLIPTGSTTSHSWYEESDHPYPNWLSAGYVRAGHTPISESRVPERVRKALVQLVEAA